MKYQIHPQNYLEYTYFFFIENLLVLWTFIPFLKLIQKQRSFMRICNIFWKTSVSLIKTISRENIFLQIELCSNDR